MHSVGLRIDVDTFRGTRLGVPALCALLREFDAGATFVFSLGPDNMGRHLFRLLKPTFLFKMLRSNAASLYGWDILFKGTFGPGPKIGRRLEETIRNVRSSGFEVGLHAWDHHAWQAKIERMTPEQLYDQIRLGVEEFTRIFGEPPVCSAAPGWKCTEEALVQKARFNFLYNSDCRGKSCFRPVVNGHVIEQPQIPVTLPTYDEIIGQGKIDDSVYNDFLLSLLEKDQLNVLTIHAEVEGIAKAGLFRRFLNLCRQNSVGLHSLGELLDTQNGLKEGAIGRRTLPGREGWICSQEEVCE